MVRLDASAVDWALLNCKRLHGMFPDNFEYKAIAHDYDDIKRLITNQDVEHWKAGPARRLLAPKGRFGFRVVTDLDPLDSIVYSALVYEIGDDIEKSRTAKEKNVVFSHRFKADSTGRLFDPNYSYSGFRDFCLSLAESGSYKFVAVADISDFFPSVYEHRLENALGACTPSSRSGYVRAIINLLKQWKARSSTGIPIGPEPSWLLSESVLSDIDRILELEGISYCRWVDDFYIFSKTSDEAYRSLCRLAVSLNENHNLHLNESKTNVITTRAFIDRYITPESQVELQRIKDLHSTFLELFGVFDPYTGIAENDLMLHEAAVKEHVSVLTEVLDRQIHSKEPSYGLIRLALWNLQLLNKFDKMGGLIDSHSRLYPITREIARFVRAAPDEELGQMSMWNRVLKAYNDPLISDLEYSRLWLLNSFASHHGVVDMPTLVSLYKNAEDNIKREILIMLGDKRESSWVGQWKQRWEAMSPWVRRAFLYAAGCLPNDERTHFFHSISSRVTPMEKAIISWKA